ncbi:hypothetical protein LPJ53_003529 [Coemansia erecta]|uniref:Uncharacterized protein n=1 Tax=Coemansia erecta TaxID=147472 RepID=A0A9W7Y136_9FUNG|nr:hypothetical protein LPJ53_003529 [Coemansia erecta]
MEHEAVGESISRLLAEVSAQREQAARFAQIVEASMVSEEEEEERGLGESPPASFLADYAHELVESYRPAKPPPRIISRRRGRRKRLERVERQSYGALAPSPPPPTNAEATAATPRRALDREKDSSFDSTKDDSERQPRADASMVSKIDRSAREQLWSRFGSGETHADERRVAALVQMAERLSLATSQPLPAFAPIASQPATTQLQSAKSHIPPPPPPDPSSSSAQLWAPDEWTQWAAFVGGPADPTVDMGEMRRRLEWVHERQADAWRHGFRDHALANGKLRRTYHGLAVQLDAYPDGNVKRVARVADRRLVASDSDSASATTLFFANGDWQCSLEPSGGAHYYYYSDEQVWCCQKPGGPAEYRYADGRVEHVDEAGSSTVTYGSGEVVVQLAARAA